MFFFSRAGANGKAHIFRVKVLIDNAINELRAAHL
jgi:hypothetical protein